MTPSSRPLPLRSCAVALALSAALLVLGSFVGAAPASAKTKFELSGRGFGHGIGMSAWGAYGQAKSGRSHGQILRHYFSGTEIAKTGTKTVRVLLSVRPDTVEFSGARKACGVSLDPGKTYQADLTGSGKVRLERGNGKRVASCGGELVARSAGKIEIAGDGTYRGKLAALPGNGGLSVVNKVDLEAYVRGVIPSEVPPSWPGAALRAQAIASRSFALVTRGGGKGFDLYDDTRSQVYGGVGAEAAETNKAVSKTSRRVVQYRGKTIQAFFSASSGGHTESIENVFGGSPLPYLKGVKDPWDDVSPYHRWKLSYSRGELQAQLGELVKGRLQKIKVTKTGVSPRIVSAKVVGSGGSTAVSGETLRGRLGLRSTWVRFKRVKG